MAAEAGSGVRGGRQGYSYVALRCVPRADREEFVNVGVVLYCQRADFLGAAVEVDRRRLQALAPGLDVDAVEEALRTVTAICDGDPVGGAPAAASLTARFGFLAAPRSTVVRPSPIHGGVTDDPTRQLQALAAALVRTPVEE